MTRNIPMRHRVLGVLLGATLAVGAVTIVASATPCTVKASPCKADVATSVYTGGPPIPVCLAGADIYTVTVTGRCKTTGNFGPASSLVCSKLGTAFSFSEDGRTHTIGISSGRTWEQAHNGNCDAITYSVS